MNPAFVFIASCLIGALIIEVRARLLNLPRYAECAQCGTNQINRDNREKKNGHRGISFDA